MLYEGGEILKKLAYDFYTFLAKEKRSRLPF